MTCTRPARTDRDCNTRLHLNGLVQAQDIKLWRTAGGDLTNLNDAAQPAEDFDLRPDQILSGYINGAGHATPRRAYQIELPPRY